MLSKIELMNRYGIYSREADFILEYMNETNEECRAMVPLVISNMKSVLRKFDLLRHSDFSLHDAQEEFNTLSEDVRNKYEGKYLVGLIEEYGFNVP